MADPHAVLPKPQTGWVFRHTANFDGSMKASSMSRLPRGTLGPCRVWCVEGIGPLLHWLNAHQRCWVQDRRSFFEVLRDPRPMRPLMVNALSGHP